MADVDILPIPDASAASGGASGVAASGRSYRGRKLGPLFFLAAGWLAFLGVLCLFAPVLPFVKDPRFPFAGNFKAAPSAEHWLGGDGIGRDIFSRVLYGGRTSLLIGVSVTVLGFLIGGFFGLTSGYFRGRYEKVVVACIDIMLAFPALVLALALVAVLANGRPSVAVVIESLSILAIAPLARITRAATLTYSQREFVVAARAMGAKNSRIIIREVLPNVIPAMISFALVVVGIVIVAEGALSFLAVGIPERIPSWGSMIALGRDDLEHYPQISLIPAAVMFVTILTLNFVGDSLRARFEVKEGAL